MTTTKNKTSIINLLIKFFLKIIILKIIYIIITHIFTIFSVYVEPVNRWIASLIVPHLLFLNYLPTDNVLSECGKKIDDFISSLWDKLPNIIRNEINMDDLENNIGEVITSITCLSFLKRKKSIETLDSESSWGNLNIQQENIKSTSWHSSLFEYPQISNYDSTDEDNPLINVRNPNLFTTESSVYSQQNTSTDNLSVETDYGSVKKIWSDSLEGLEGLETSNIVDVEENVNSAINHPHQNIDDLIKSCKKGKKKKITLEHLNKPLPKTPNEIIEELMDEIRNFILELKLDLQRIDLENIDLLKEKRDTIISLRKEIKKISISEEEIENKIIELENLYGLIPLNNFNSEELKIFNCSTTNFINWNLIYFLIYIWLNKYKSFKNNKFKIMFVIIFTINIIRFIVYYHLELDSILFLRKIKIISLKIF